MTRASRVRCLFVALALILGIIPGASAAKRPETIQLTILHTNDTHDHLLPFGYPKPWDMNTLTARLEHTRDIGGIARRATLVKRIRKEPNRSVLLVDAGDVLDGTPFSVEYKGEADFAAMAACGYDVMTWGNHEYDCTPEQWGKHRAQMKFPVVCANVFYTATGQPAFRPYLIKNLQGVKVAIFGLVTPDAAYYPSARGRLEFHDPVQTARELVPKLRDEADYVILLSHLGVSSDSALAQSVPGIDVIVCGHDHARLDKPTLVKTPAPAGSIGGTLLVEDYQHGGDLGRLDLRLKDVGSDYATVAYCGKLIPITNTLPEDKAVAAVVERYRAPIRAKYETVIGRASAPFYHDRPGEKEAQNLVCDAMREITGAQVAFYGNVRATIDEGPITASNLSELIPFDNRVVILDITGDQLIKTYEYYPAGISGGRYKVRDKKVVEFTVNGKPVDPDATYTLAITDYLMNYSPVLKGLRVSRDTGQIMREMLRDYVHRKGVVSPVLDGRLDVK